MNISIEQKSPTEYDLKMPELKQDAHLRLEKGEWIMDIFDSTETDNYAHIETVTLSKGNHSVTSPDWNAVFEFLF